MSDLFREPVIAESEEPQVVEIRCPNGLGKLFAKIQLSGDKPAYTEDNWLEIACYDCRKDLQRTGRNVKMVFHYYNFLGELVRSSVVRG